MGCASHVSMFASILRSSGFVCVLMRFRTSESFAADPGVLSFDVSILCPSFSVIAYDPRLVMDRVVVFNRPFFISSLRPRAVGFSL